MSPLQECRRCVMNSSDPLIEFDENGFCNHCTDALSRRPNMVFTGEVGHDRTLRKAEEIRARNRSKEFDAVIGLSGGVDSSYAAIAASQAGLRLLAVHCDTGWNSEEAVHNIQSLVDRLGIHLETVVVNWESMRNAQAAFFRASPRAPRVAPPAATPTNDCAGTRARRPQSRGGARSARVPC